MARMGVYKLVNATTGRFYLGSSQDLARRERGHMRALRKGTHHNANVQKLYAKYGPDDFSFEVVYFTTSIERARKLEDKLLKSTADSKKCLNIGCSAVGGDNLTRNPKRESIVKRITKAVHDRYATLSASERKATYRSPGELNGMYGKTHSKAARKKISEAHKGKSPNKGIPKSEEGRANMALAAQARVSKKGYKNPFEGKTHSAETREVLRQIANERITSGVLPGNARKVKIGKTMYRSVTEASRELGTCAATIINRIRNPKFPKYRYLD